MASIKRGIDYLLRDQKKFWDVLLRNCMGWLPDKLYLSLRYRCLMGSWINWKNPKTFTEKLQWLKLYNRKPEYTTMVDKYAVKQYVADRIGEKYIIPTLGVWDKFEDIDFSKLPKQFVLKTTHGGGSCGVVICRDKSTFDKTKAQKIIENSMKSDIYRLSREWPYKNVPKRIIGEKFIAPQYSMAPTDLPDYKFFCFNGEPKYCQVIRDRRSNETIDFYDMEWNHQEFVGLNPVARNGLNPVARPVHFDEMINICRKLSKDIPFVRVDLYIIDDKEFFGELTFYPASGIGVFTPEEWMHKLGDLLALPTIGGGYKCLLKTDNVEIMPKHIEYEELLDYKFFCFNGIVKFFKVDFGRFTEHHANYYSTDGHLLDYGESGLEPCPGHHIELPGNLPEMINIAERLSMNEPFLRVDLYNIYGKIFFGEITFFPASGMLPWTTKETDNEVGNYLTINC